MDDGGRVVLGDVTLAHARRGRRRRAADVENVLDRDRYAVQWSAIPSGRQLAVRLARLTPRLVCGDENERVQPRVVGLNPPQAFIHCLDRAHLARAKPPAELLDCQRRWALDRRRSTRDCRLSTRDCRLSTLDSRLLTLDFRLSTTFVRHR